ncbi:hypothetical protein ElyMa_003451900 [Elysia marginata]|uniref:Uncharacterized protein n=1 Tax=Elysia marginata TaxID=1093978 RepID=A0AAV4JVS6_9GAST|nr:hypothetical protein ElyMa_003451900 [Elysia marginata]
MPILTLIIAQGYTTSSRKLIDAFDIPTHSLETVTILELLQIFSNYQQNVGARIEAAYGAHNNTIVVVVVVVEVVVVVDR